MSPTLTADAEREKRGAHGTAALRKCARIAGRPRLGGSDDRVRSEPIDAARGVADAPISRPLRCGREHHYCQCDALGLRAASVETAAWIRCVESERTATRYAGLRRRARRRASGSTDTRRARGRSRIARCARVVSEFVGREDKGMSPGLAPLRIGTPDGSAVPDHLPRSGNCQGAVEESPCGDTSASPRSGLSNPPAETGRPAGPAFRPGRSGGTIADAPRVGEPS